MVYLVERRRINMGTIGKALMVLVDVCVVIILLMVLLGALDMVLLIISGGNYNLINRMVEWVGGIL